MSQRAEPGEILKTFTFVGEPSNRDVRDVIDLTLAEDSDRPIPGRFIS